MSHFPRNSTDDLLDIRDRQIALIEKFFQGNNEAQHESRSRLDHALMDIRAGMQLEELGYEELDALAFHADSIAQDILHSRTKNEETF